MVTKNKERLTSAPFYFLIILRSVVVGDRGGSFGCQLTTVDNLVVKDYNDSMEQKNFSVADVAGLLGMTRQAVLKKIKTGELRAQKVGRSYVVQKTDLPIWHGGELTEAKKEVIKQAVKKAVKDYGETLKMLGKE